MTDGTDECLIAALALLLRGLIPIPSASTSCTVVLTSQNGDHCIEARRADGI